MVKQLYTMGIGEHENVINIKFPNLFVGRYHARSNNALLEYIETINK